MEITNNNNKMKKNTINRVDNFRNYSPKVDELNKYSVGCVPCKSNAMKIKRKINGRKLSELKIDEIKKIVQSIFASSKE